MSEMVDITQPLYHEWVKDMLAQALARLGDPSVNPYENNIPVCRFCFRPYSEAESTRECSSRLRTAVTFLTEMR